MRSTAMCAYQGRSGWLRTYGARPGEGALEALAIEWVVGRRAALAWRRGHGPRRRCGASGCPQARSAAAGEG